MQLVKHDKQTAEIVFSLPNGMSYEVPLYMLETYRSVLHFVSHVATKSWATPAHLKQFVDLVSEIRDWNIQNH